MKSKLFQIIILTLMCLAIPIGCATKLEGGGKYSPATTNAVTGAVTVAPDKAFFVADAAFDLAYATAKTATDFEQNNRLLLWQISPEIKHGLDKVRPQLKAATVTYALAKRAYKKNPTPGGLSALQTALGHMQQVAAAAQAALPK